jgi:uncharacterized membrane protein (UPF0127 family)/CheY-like chemotaxis protein
MRGLMGRGTIERGEGMLLRPAPAIHTAFMRFPIDVLFLDDDFCVLSIVEEMRPWRTASNRKARAVLELAAGEIRERGIKPGNQLLLLHDDPSLSDDGQPTRPPKRIGVQLRAAFRPARAVQRAKDQVQAPADGEPAPISILLVSGDRRFRAVASALLERRGCNVTVSDGPEHVTGAAGDGGSDVVVLDVGRATSPARALARLRARLPYTGLVLVGDELAETAGLLVRAKWGMFDDLVSAIHDANSQRSSTGARVEQV